MGKGDNVLIAFHGFGQEANVFNGFAAAVAEEYTVFSFDLFYHGMSSRTVESPLTKELWTSSFLQFCRQEALSKYELLGFSFGGRFALTSMMAKPLDCTKLHLMAPDGIKSSFWYELATFPGISEKMFKKFLDRPSGLFRFINYIEKLKLISEGALKFAKSQLETKEQRDLIYLTWTMFRPLKYNQTELSGMINKYEIPTSFYLGKYDKIISEDKFVSFSKSLNYHQKFLINCGHEQLISKSIPFFLK